MRKVLFSASLMILVTFFAVVPALASSTVLHDNEHMRVTFFTLDPNEAAGLKANNLNRVVVFLDAGKVKHKSVAGKSEMLTVKAGEVRWVPAAEDITANAGGPLQFMAVEIKGTKQPKVEVPELDPIKVDPKHWSLDMENEYVRVGRVRFGPLEKGVLHQHVRNYVVVYLNKQAKGDRGSATPHIGEGTTTHTENNPLDYEVERVAIELK
ncbi:MAG: hypothetical protein AB7O65_05180 [Candidatus Korobacteraceae bacterium]